MFISFSTFKEAKLIFQQAGENAPAAAEKTLEQKAAPAIAAAKRANAKKMEAQRSFKNAEDKVSGSVNPESDDLLDYFKNIGAPLIGSVMAATRMGINPIISPVETIKHPIKNLGAPAAQAATGSLAAQLNAAALPTRLLNKTAGAIEEYTPNWGPLKIVKWTGKQVHRATKVVNYVPDKVAKVSTKAYKKTTTWGK